ncbi:hypothetical protein [Streptomyces tauricus]|uniref:hypothetical protein n=1 Tax=Streptomyces tauricus TaxID=68274 RepID=UPI0022436D35|nr:hypothetical protein [Streptomyces tauricus]MCW8102665.1 hypothetical protein [Streptomyces tauricus]
MLDPASLPHWPYAHAVDQELTRQGIPPGAVRVERGYRYEITMRIVFSWEASRCAGPGGIRLTWNDDTGWTHSLLRPDAVGVIPRGPLTALHRVFATPHDVAQRSYPGASTSTRASTAVSGSRPRGCGPRSMPST